MLALIDAWAGAAAKTAAERRLVKNFIGGDVGGVSGNCEGFAVDAFVMEGPFRLPMT